MLTMRIVTDSEEISAFAEQFGVNVSEGVCLYLAENRGTVLGGCFYRFNEEGMEILFADTEGDIPLFDGLIRAAMAALFDQEKDKVVFADSMDKELLKNCRFIEGDECCINSANVFFDTHKNCKN